MTRYKFSCGRNHRLDRVRRLLLLTLIAVLSGAPVGTSAEEASDRPVEDTVLTGTVVDRDGNPVEGATVEGLAHRDLRQVMTAADGHFELALPTSRLRGLSIIGRADDDRLMTYHRLPWEIDATEILEPVRLQLQPSVSIQVRVVDANDAAVPEAWAGLMGEYAVYNRGTTDTTGRVTFRIPANATVQAICARKDGLGLDYRMFYDRRRAQQDLPQERIDWSQPVELKLEGARTVRAKLVNAVTGEPLEGIDVYPWLLRKPSEANSLNLSYFVTDVMSRTGADGVATFDWLPKWDDSITFVPSVENYARTRAVYEAATGDGTVVLRLHKLVPISGHVRSPDGQPAADVSVLAVGRGYSTDGFHQSAKTDGTGRYEFMATPDMLYLLVVDDEEWATAPLDGFVVRPGEPIDGLDFTLRPATRLYGRVTVGPEEMPVSGQRMSCVLEGRDLHNLEGVELPNEEESRLWVQPTFYRFAETDADGWFQFHVGPGSYRLSGPQQAETRELTVAEESSLEVNFHADRPEEGRLKGVVVTGNPPRPVPHSKIQGIYRHQRSGRDLEIAADEDGRFDVTRKLHRTVFYARNDDGRLAGVVEIGPDDKDVTIPIGRLASARGRVIDESMGAPLAAGGEILYGVPVHIGDDDAPFRTEFGGRTQVDEQGRFVLKRLVLGQTYRLSYPRADGHSYARLGEVTPASAEVIDLGDLTLERPYRPPTLAERIDRSFENEQPAAQRLPSLLRDAKLGRLRVLVILADPQAEATRQLYTLRYENEDIRRALDYYRLLSASTEGDDASGAIDLADGLQIKLDDPKQPRLIALAADGTVLANVTAHDLSADGSIDAQTLVRFLDDFSLPPLDAREVLADALARAKRENKRVFLQETASWCGPCWLLSRFLDEHQDTFEKDYIHIKIDHRWKDWRAVMEPLQEEPAGIPWTAILDADGDVLITSDGPDGNIGYPSSTAGVEHFLKMLRETSIRLTEDDLRKIERALNE